MDLDICQETPLSPEPPVIEIEPEPIDRETGREHVEERIRLLEAVCSRFMHRQGETAIATGNGGAMKENLNTLGKLGKRVSTHLVAKALGSSKKKKRGATGGYFSCNICLDKALDPILTSCGHLFCWPCFYDLPCAYSNVKECPVCEGEVTDSNVIPIYGTAADDKGCQSRTLGCDSKVPPRPRAKRVESMRQKITPQDSFRTVNLNSLRRTYRTVANPFRITSSVTQHIPGIERGWHNPSAQLLRMPTPRETSISSPFSLNSAMNTSLRLLDYMDAFLSDGQIRTVNQGPSYGAPRVYYVSVTSVDSRSQNADGIRPTEVLSSPPSEEELTPPELAMLLEAQLTQQRISTDAVT